MRKHKGLMLVLAIVATLGLVTMAYAAKGAKGGKGGKGGKTPPAPQASVELTASVTKVQDGKVTVSLELPTESSTSVVINGESGKAVSDLKPGQDVKVTFSGNLASRIEVTP